MQQVLFRRLLFAGYLCLAAGSIITATSEVVTANNTLQRLNLETQPKVVKIFGVGGFRQLEAYQTGIFVSPSGHILTAQSLVLDQGEVTVVQWDGKRTNGKVIGIDPVKELALVKIDVSEPAEHFPLESVEIMVPGTRVLAFANVFGIAVYDEPVSVLQGVITGVAPLSARRGSFHANYSGKIYVLDAATNNPGAAGGAVTDLSGRLIGLIGKELRSESAGTWLNYCLPTEALREPVEQMMKGESSAPPQVVDDPRDRNTLGSYGIVLVPDVLERTPPYIDRVVKKSSAARAGLRPDDLLVAVEGRTVTSQRDLIVTIASAPDAERLSLTVLRDRDLVQVSMEPVEMLADRNE